MLNLVLTGFFALTPQRMQIATNLAHKAAAFAYSRRDASRAIFCGKMRSKSLLPAFL
jgi:hypothetical protein